MPDIEIYWKPEEPVDCSQIRTEIRGHDFSENLSISDRAKINLFWNEQVKSTKKAGKNLPWYQERGLGTLYDTSKEIVNLIQLILKSIYLHPGVLIQTIN